MAQAIASWWSGLSDYHKGASLIVTTVMATASATAAGVLSWHQFKGLPDRVDNNTAAITVNAKSVDSLRATIEDFGEGQERIVCMLLAEANGANPLGCL